MSSVKVSGVLGQDTLNNNNERLRQNRFDGILTRQLDQNLMRSFNLHPQLSFLAISNHVNGRLIGNTDRYLSPGDG